MTGWFPAAVYVLCFVTSSACAFLLARSYWRTGARLLLWSAVCFVFLGLNNLAVIFDLVVLPEHNIILIRAVLALTGIAVLLFGLVWNSGEDA